MQYGRTCDLVHAVMRLRWGESLLAIVLYLHFTPVHAVLTGCRKIHIDCEKPRPNCNTYGIFMIKHSAVKVQRGFSRRGCLSFCSTLFNKAQGEFKYTPACLCITRRPLFTLDYSVIQLSLFSTPSYDSPSGLALLYKYLSRHLQLSFFNILAMVQGLHQVQSGPLCTPRSP